MHEHYRRPATTEAEIQAELYAAAKRSKIHARLEIITWAGILDFAVESADGSGLLLAVEIKRSMDALNHLQLAKYRELRIPIYTLCERREIPGIIRRIKAKLPECDCVSWARILKG